MNGNSVTKKKKRSNAAIARRSAKWETQKALKRNEAIRKVKGDHTRVMQMIPDVLSIVGAQGFMPNLKGVKTVSKRLKSNLSVTPLFTASERATIYPKQQTLLTKYMDEGKWEDAIKTINQGVPKRILEHHGYKWENNLAYAFDQNQFTFFEKLLEKRFDPNLPVKTVFGGKVHNISILSYILKSSATKDVKIKYIKELLKYKIDLNEIDALHSTPLDYAIKNKNLEIVKLFLEKGANPKQETKKGYTPFLSAITHGTPEIVEYIYKNSHINLDQGVGALTPLKLATVNGSLLTFKIILNGVKNLDQKDSDGNTALYFAVRSKNSEKISLLINKGANPKLPNKEGKTAMDFADGFTYPLLIAGKPI